MIQLTLQIYIMKKYKRKFWEVDIGMKIISESDNINRFKTLINTSIDIVQNKAESEFNPHKYNLSDEAKKRLKWRDRLIKCVWQFFACFIFNRSF